MIIFTCPYCGLQRSVSRERIGKPIRCRGCEESFTLTDQNSRRENGNDDRPGNKASKSPTDASEESPGWWEPVVEGALPGATAGLVTGTLAGALSDGIPDSGLSWGVVGLVVGLLIGVFLGGLAGDVSRRAGLEGIWSHFRAPLFLGGLVGLASCGAVGSVRLLPWAALAGVVAAAVWPLLGLLVDSGKPVGSDPLADKRTEANDPSMDTRHYVDPSELKEARRLGKRRHAE